jgi:ribosomal protein S18 acetylase RimI-like enzyme
MDNCVWGPQGYKEEMRCEIVRDAEGFAGLLPAWGRVWEASARAVTLHPAWADAWWATLGGEGELMIVACRDGEELVGVAPLYLTPPRGGALRARELRAIGGGVVVGCGAILARAGREAEVRAAVAETIGAEKSWDVLDVAAAEVGELEALGQKLGALGWKVEVGETEGRPEAVLDEAFRRWLDGWPAAPLPAGGEVVEYRGERVAEGLAKLGGLSRGRAAEPAFVRFLELAGPRLAEAGAALLVGVDMAGAAIAGALVVREEGRWVELVSTSEAATREAVRRAIEAGARRFVFAGEEQQLTTARSKVARLRASAAAQGMIQRGYASLVRRAEAVADAARDRLREVVAPEAVQRAVARVATFARLHLYRGELFVRGGAPPQGAQLRLFGAADFEALADRAAFAARLGLSEAYCRQKWERGDTVVLAEIDGQPAGILWCARAPVYVPDIGREVRPLAGECYIHDVYVPPEARGRALAPAMLDFLARELRGRDIYRAWALIERSNAAAPRAFEKAAYASVADVIYARMGLASKLLVRPPDPEARSFLGVVAKR